MLVSVSDRQEIGSIDEANSRLAEGLKSCRAVIRNYRSLLTVDLDRDTAFGPAIPLQREDPGQAALTSSKES